jgi:phenylacetyl-CoA:acceptor oxidoreductase subunit 1
MTRWAMVADLERCVGCQTCTAACRHTNATAPSVQWRSVLDIETGSYPKVSRTFVPVGCQHCADPPCMHVCPTGATGKRADGIVTVDYDLCIGCAYCDMACPYQARFKLDGPKFAFGSAATSNEIEREDPRRLGVAQKCTFCSDRIDFGLANGLTPGVDPRATPACVNACIASALHFGDLDDEASNVSRLLRNQKPLLMHEELATAPGFFYLDGRDHAPTPNRSALTGQLRDKGVAPAHQRHWDWKAAGNFICGGAGAGLFLAAALAGPDTFQPLGALALAIAALGLFLLLFKIGRPLRALYVLRQPQRSWMAREAWIVGALFPLGALAVWSQSPLAIVPAAIAAALFLFSQAMILREAKGIPAWRTPLIVPLIVATGLAEGTGLLLAAAPLLPSLASLAGAIAAAVLALLRAWLWRLYIGALRLDGAPVRSLDVLSAFSPWLSLLGLALPLGLIGAGLALEGAASPLFAIAGISILATGSALKFVLVTRAGFNQGFALPRPSAQHIGSGASAKPQFSTPPLRGDRAMKVQTRTAQPSTLMLDPAAETMPRPALAELQTQRLKRTLEQAYANVPHYRRKFDAAGVKPGDLRTSADLSRFPFAVKTDLRDNYPFGMFAVPREQLIRLHASSGTTGKATVVGYTKGDLDRWADLMALAGLRRGQARRHRPQRLRLRPLHRRARRPLRCRAARLHRGAAVRRRHRAPSDPPHRFRRTRAVRNALVCAEHCRGRERYGHRPAKIVAAPGAVRRRALERCHAPRPGGPARHQGHGHLRPLRDHGAGRCL